jgi:hypothetical protein
MGLITLAQLADIETEPLRKGIILNLLRDSKVLELLPFENVTSLRTVVIKWKTLPSNPAWRKLNEGYSSGYGETDQVQESIYGFGGDINYDRVLDKVTNVVIPMKTLQTQMFLKAKALVWNDYFINGDHATDEDGIEGIKKRVANMPARQTVSCGITNSWDPTADAASARRFMDDWEKAYYRCNGGKVSAIFLNEDLMWGFGRVIRYLNLTGAGVLSLAKDQFEREIMSYKGAKFVDMGLKRDQSTEIITDTEAAADGTGDATSAYFVSFGLDEGLIGIQLENPAIYDPLSGGEQESTPTKLLRLDWWNGLANFGSYGITRLWNIEAPDAWT